MNLCTNRQKPGFSRNESVPQPAQEALTLSFAEPPANLREWFSDPTICLWVHQQVQRVHWTDLGVPSRLASADARGLLAVLAFALVGLIFGSDEIAHACRSDATFQRLAGGAAFFPHEVWSARRKYRAQLEQVLTGVLTEAIRSRFGLASSSLPAELQEDLRWHAAERLEIARHIDTCTL